MNKQIVIDIETLGVRPGSIILSVAALCIDLDDLQEFEEITSNLIASTPAIMSVPNAFFSHTSYEDSSLIFVKLPIMDSLLEGFTTDESTCKWWKKQSNSLLAQNITAGPVGGLKESLEILIKWLSLNKGIPVWANSPKFDLTLLEAYFTKFELKSPIKYTEERDVRTLRKVFNLPYLTKEGLEPHNPIHDCIIQADAVIRAYHQVQAYEKISSTLMNVAIEQSSVSQTSTLITA